MKKIRLKKQKLQPEIEFKHDYIAFRNTQMYAKTDIPLVPNGTNRLLYYSPKKVWETYRTDEMPHVRLKRLATNGSIYDTQMWENSDGAVTVSLYVYGVPSKRAVILTDECGKVPQKEIIERFVKDGFLVCLPDYCGVFPQTNTSFPLSLQYGLYGKSGEHLTKITASPQDTCNYLYAKILRRTVSFLEEEFQVRHPVLIGIRGSVEYVMQAGGIDPRIKGIGCLCCCGYSEFSNRETKQDFDKIYDEKEIEWLTSVSGVSYLKDSTVSVFVGVGSNADKGDLARVRSLADLVGKDRLRLCVANGLSENVNENVFSMLRLWTRLIYMDSTLPPLPTASISVNKDGSVYATVSSCAPVPTKSSKLYFSFDVCGHTMKKWYSATCETIGKGEYIARIPIKKENAILSFYADVSYENGTTVSGLMQETDLTGKKVTIEKEASGQIFVFGRGEERLNEYNPETPVLFETITSAKVPAGPEGVLCKTGNMYIYLSDMPDTIHDDGLLQVDSFSADHTYTLCIALVDRKGNVFRASLHMKTYDVFATAKFRRYDFKDEKFRSIPSWQDAKGLIIETKNVIIGKLLFM